MHAMGGSSPELRLPTVTVAVELARAGRAAERVELFVAEGGGHEAVAALLESDSQFLPVREPDAPGGVRVALVGKRAIVWVAVALVAAAEGLALYDHRHEVRIELDIDAAEPISGHVLYSSPADRPRLIDHLNVPGHFLRVWTADALYLVNKHHVVRVVELT